MNFDFAILYVADVARSAAFYTQLLGQAPLRQSEDFGMYRLANGVHLGLWQRNDVAPSVGVAPGGSEIAFTVADDETLRARHAEWAARGVAIAQAPEALDFGLTFTALDPDGHRVRVFAPSRR